MSIAAPNTVPGDVSTAWTVPCCARAVAKSDTNTTICTAWRGGVVRLQVPMWHWAAKRKMENRIRKTGCLRSSRRSLSRRNLSPQSTVRPRRMRVGLWCSPARLGYYETSSLFEVGVKLHLGHGGLPCPSDMFTKLEKIRIVDITGVHDVCVAWCGCHTAQERALQVVSLGLYPASVISPKTAFTFRVLSDFLLANKVSGIAAQSYFQRLRRLTNPAFPHKVPVSA